MRRTYLLPVVKGTVTRPLQRQELPRLCSHSLRRRGLLVVYRNRGFALVSGAQLIQRYIIGADTTVGGKVKLSICLEYKMNSNSATEEAGVHDFVATLCRNRVLLGETDARKNTNPCEG